MTSSGATGAARAREIFWIDPDSLLIDPEAWTISSVLLNAFRRLWSRRSGSELTAEGEP
jgi:hypothetical protein